MLNPVFEIIWALRVSLARSLAIGLLLPLAACASFDGHPRPVIAPTNVSSQYHVEEALTEFYSRPPGQARTDYRDMIIGIYMNASEARYQEFRRLLSREIKGSNFGLGLGALGLSTGASIAGERAANILSAGAAALTGAKTGLAKEVYFEKTLPALIAGMEAARTRVRTNILTRMQKPADVYTLPQAFMDLNNYETAASLDSAIEMVTADASRRVAVEENAYDDVALTLTGAPETGTGDALRAAGTMVRALKIAGDNETLGRIAKELDIAPGATAQDTAAAIENELDEADSVAAANALGERILKAAPPPVDPAPGPTP